MGWILSTILLALIAVAAVFLSRAYRKAAIAEHRDENLKQARTTETAIVVGCIALFLVLTFVSSAHQVKAGNVGVVYQFGAIKGQISEGLQFTAPWQSVVTASIQVQRHTFEQIDSASQETQDVFVKATVNYSVSPSTIQNLYRTVGPNWFDTLVESRVLNFFKEETVKYKAVDILPNREQIRDAVKTKLIAALSPYSITVVDLLIDNIHFSADFTKAIEAKQIAIQNALEEQQKIAVAKAQADQRVATAQGDAESVLIAARAQAQANDLLDKSLTPQLIQYTAIQKLSDNVSLVLVPQDGNFLFNLGSAQQVAIP
jgi:regulator of protease activity HflC (stomatin/prohibitin superfamily)